MKAIKLTIKELTFVVYVVLKRLEIAFIKPVYFVKKCCSEKISCPSYNIILSRSSPNKQEKGHIQTKLLILVMIKHVVTNYKRLHEIT